MNYEYSKLEHKILEFTQREIAEFIKNNDVDLLCQFAFTYDSENFGLYLSFNNKEQHELNKLNGIDDFDTINWKYDCFANIYLLDFKQIDILNERMSYANDNQWIDFLENQTINVGMTLKKMIEMPFFRPLQDRAIQIIFKETEDTITESKERWKELNVETKN